MAPRVFVISPRYERLHVNRAEGVIQPLPAEDETYTHLILEPEGEGEPDVAPVIMGVRGLPDAIAEEELEHLHRFTGTLTFSDLNAWAASKHGDRDLFLLLGL